MPEKKTSLTIDESVWKAIKKAAIDAGKTIGEYIAWLFVNRKE